MSNLQQGESSHCRELERLAAAAATLDYSDISASGQQPMSEHRPAMIVETSEGVVPQNIPQVISYIDPYQLSRSNQFVPFRAYEAEQVNPDPIRTPIQHRSCSRVLMIPFAGGTLPTSEMQYCHPVTHFAVTGIPYHTADIAILSEEMTQPSFLEPQRIEQNIPCTDTAKPANENDLRKVLTIDSAELTSSPVSSSGIVTNITTAPLGKRKIKKPVSFQEYDTGEAESRNAIERPLSIPSGAEITDASTDFGGKVVDVALPKRNGLPLEVKIEIIKRISAGEKKVDISEEYCVNQSTIKSIMKKADIYMGCWKKGLFNPDSKRLKRPKREDVEQALFSWYRQSLENSIPVSGTILCSKAVDFAHKLGHFDFKATHGWLDRFKKRKKITFGRGSSKRKRETDDSNASVGGPNASLLPQVLIDYEPTDIFALDHIGLFYNVLPTVMDSLRGLKCAGGVKSKDRLSVVLCTNMLGSEKFPLLVVGRCKKFSSLMCVKTLPVHYIANESSWLTCEIMLSWFLDLDSWFIQQNRKVIMLVPTLPIYSKPIVLKAIKLIIMAPGSLSPFQHLVIPAFRKYYRKLWLEEAMASFLKDPSKKPVLPIYSCLRILALSWQSVSESLVVNAFQRTGLAKYGMWSMSISADDPTLVGAQEGMMNTLQALGLGTNEISFSEYVTFDSELQVCNMMGDDDILAKVINHLDEDHESDPECDKENDKQETHSVKPHFSQVESAFGVLRKYIQYQEGAQEMFRELAQLEYIIYKALPEEAGECHTQLLAQ